MSEWWNYGGRPQLAGWYPVLVCYDAREGIFPASAYWDGVKWGRSYVVAFGERRYSRVPAELLAHEHDPDAGGGR